MRAEKRLAAAILLVGLSVQFAASSCTGAQPYIATETALKVSSDEFALTAQLMDQALDAKRVSVEDYRKWAVFASQFKASWNLAADLWTEAVKNSDKTRIEQASAILAGLAAELSGFFNAVTNKKPDGGA